MVHACAPAFPGPAGSVAQGAPWSTLVASACAPGSRPRLVPPLVLPAYAPGLCHRLCPRLVPRLVPPHLGLQCFWHGFSPNSVSDSPNSVSDRGFSIVLLASMSVAARPGPSRVVAPRVAPHGLYPRLVPPACAPGLCPRLVPPLVPPACAHNPPQAHTWRKALACKRGLGTGACVQALRAESTRARKCLAPSLRLQTVWGL